MLEVGRRMGVRQLAEDRTGAAAGVGTVASAVFALLGLLIAFTFSGGDRPAVNASDKATAAVRLANRRLE